MTNKDENSNDAQHCFKLTDIVADKFHLMNPSTYNPNQIEEYSWKKIQSFEAASIVFMG